MGKQESETPGMCVRSYTYVCAHYSPRERRRRTARRDSCWSSEISSVTLGTHTQRTHEKRILDTGEGFGETPGLDTHGHADNSKLPPHEFCSCLNLLDIFIQA